LIRNGLEIVFLLLVVPALALAQDPAPSAQALDPGPSLTPTAEFAPAPLIGTPRRPPIAAGYASSLSLNAGYSVTGLNTPSSLGAALSGVDTGVSIDFRSHFGAQLDLDYGSTSNFLNSGHSLTQFSYLVGPTFRFSSTNRLHPHLHFLVGGARTSGAAPNGSGGFVAGYVNYPAWAAGGSLEYPFSRRWGVRVSMDYMRTYFFDSSVTVRGQSGLRLSTSLVYYFSGPSIRLRHRR